MMSASVIKLRKKSLLWMFQATVSVCVWQNMPVDAYAQNIDPSAVVQAMEAAGFQGDEVAFENQRKTLEALDTPDAYSRLAALYESLPSKDMQRVAYPKTAAEYYQKAIDTGIARNMRDDAWRKAYVALAMMYRRGEGVEKSEAKAVELLKLAMEAGHGGAAYQYGRMLETGFEGNKADVKAAASVYLSAVNMKSGEAALALARLYRSGMISTKTSQEADEMTARGITLLRESSDKGNGMAAYLAGYLYETGDGVEKDLGEALKWYDKGAKLGAPAALTAAARLYGQGAGGSNNIQKATLYMRRAAQAGSVNAALELGESLFSSGGYYIAVDKQEALMWLKRAAESNNTRAINRLAEWYLKSGSAESALPYLQKAAQRNTFTAYYSMYRIYSGVGKEGALDTVKAKETFEKALALKELKPEERIKLLRILMSPEEPVHDPKRAYDLLLPLANKGSVLAIDALADGFESGYFGATDYKQALAWRTKGAAKGDVSSMLSLAVAYRDGQVTARDMKQYEAYLNKAIANVSATDYATMTKIGRMFKLHTEGTHDNQKALYWFERAAKGGNPVGQLEFGRVVILGGVNGYPAERAIPMFEAAAAAGSRDAMLELGRAYSAGRGVRVDVREAAKYFLRAAAKGHIEAMRQAGIIMIAGRGVKQDAAAGVQWLEQSAAAGNTLAWVDLGAFYYYVPPVNEAKAVQYWEKAARAGVVDGQYFYGMALLHGRGIGADKAQAKIWLKKAADAGNRMAKQQMVELDPAALQATTKPAVATIDNEDSEDDQEWGEATPAAASASYPPTQKLP
jgi:TPR repeat protein